MHAVVAVREAEVDVAATELNGLGLLLFVVVGTDDGRIVDGTTGGILQHAALLPYLIGAGKHGNVVEQHRVAAHVGEYQKTCRTVEQCLDRTVETLDMMQLDTLRLLVVDIVGEIGILLVRNMELAGHRVEHADSLQAIVAAELHETQQQQGLLTAQNLAMQGGADAFHRCLAVEVVSHLVGHAHVAVEVEIQVNVADTEMTTQVTHEHFLGS